MLKKCIICDNEYKRYGKQAETAKFCSRRCMGIFNMAAHNSTCSQCKCSFHLKESAIKRYNRNMGIFCSTFCASEYKRQYYIGINNPNFRGAQYDGDGYRVNHYPKVGRVKEHKFVTLAFLKIKEIPKGFCIHHRDCNIYNNEPINLAVLKKGDHRWLHKQYGNATLWAYLQNKVTLNELVSWSNDQDRAKKLLPLSILNQLDCINTEWADELSETERGSGGYGHTGK